MKRAPGRWAEPADPDGSRRINDLQSATRPSDGNGCGRRIGEARDTYLADEPAQ